MDIMQNDVTDKKKLYYFLFIKLILTKRKKQTKHTKQKIKLFVQPLGDHKTIKRLLTSIFEISMR